MVAGRGVMLCSENLVLELINKNLPLPSGTTFVGIEFAPIGDAKIWSLTVESDLLPHSDEPHKNVIIDWTKEEDTGEFNFLGIRKGDESFAEKYGG